MSAILQYLAFFALGYFFVTLILSPKKAPERETEGESQEHEEPKTPDAEPTCYEILGVLPGASKEEIKQAYRLKMKQYHPDNVANLGVEFQALAETKAKEINLAYEEALKHC